MDWRQAIYHCRFVACTQPPAPHLSHDTNNVRNFSRAFELLVLILFADFATNRSFYILV